MTKKFTFLLMALLALTGFRSWGQEEITIGNGTISNEYKYPFQSYYNYSYNEMLYTAEEIGTSGRITSISFNATNVITGVDYVVDVYMKNVTRDSFSSSTDWETTDGSTLVWSGTISGSSDGWTTITLTNAFEYLGGNYNLMIAFDNNTGDCAKKYFYCHEAEDNMSHCVYTDYSNIDPSNPPTSIAGWTYASLDVNRPNIKLGIETGPKFTVTVNQPEVGGTISADPIANVAPETAVTLNATPSFGYEFGQWTVVDEDGNPVTLNGEATVAANGFAMPESNVTVSATFNALDMYDISLSVNDENLGEALVTYDGESVEQAPAGTTLGLLAFPNEHCNFVKWTVDGEDYSTEAEHYYIMPDHAVSIVAVFEAEPTYEVVISDEIENGTISVNPSEYYAGETVTLNIEPATGYALTTLTVTEATSGNEVEVNDNTFVMPEDDVNVTATFSEVYYVQIDPSIVGGTIAHMSTTPGETAYAAGTGVYFIPNPTSDDYEYVEQSFVVTTLEHHPGEEPEWVEVPVAVDYNSGMAHIVMPAGNVTVTASFNKVKFAVTQQIVNPMGSGYCYLSKTEHIEKDEWITISYSPEDGYMFNSVSVICDNAAQTEVPAFPYYGTYTFQMPESDVIVTVNFEEKPKYDVTVGTVTNGTVTVEDATSFMADETVWLNVQPQSSDYILESITATPEEGDPITPTHNYGNYYTFTMPASNVEITASFRELQSYTINYYVNGEIEKSLQCREDYPVNIDAPAVVPAGMTFEGWGIADIDTYLTEKPAIVGNYELPTQNYDLYAVLSYAEQVPATSKDGDKWVKVTSVDELTDGLEVVFLFDYEGYKVMCQRRGQYEGEFKSESITVVDGEVSSLNANATIFTLNANGNSTWEIVYDDPWFGSSTLCDYFWDYNHYLRPYEIGYEGCNTWNITNYWGTITFSDTEFGLFISYNDGKFVSAEYNPVEMFKKGASTITTTYYMTEVLTQGEIEDYTAKNIIVVNPITVSGRLEMNANGLFRNANTANFVFANGAQFYYTGTEAVNATFQKSINGYTNAEGRDGYYLIANPTDNPDVIDLYFGHDLDLYTFDGSEEQEWRNQGASWNWDITRGTGYLYATPEDITAEFNGNLLPAGSTDVFLNYYSGTESGREFPGFNLIGNPYACNVYLNKPALRLNAAGNDFEPIETGEAIAPCEGFFVEADGPLSMVTLNTTDPETEGNIIVIVEQNRGNVIDRAIVNFDGRSDLHKFMMNPEHTNIRLAKNGEEFAAISSDAEGEIPVSFKAEKDGTYTINVKAENVEARYLHLIDNMTGMDVDLLSTPSYTFNASTRDYAYRFKLVFSMTGVENNQSSANSFAYISNGNLVIDNIEGEATMQIVDMLGRVVSTEIVSGSYNKALNLNAGLYIINLNGMTQKIVVK